MVDNVDLQKVAEEVEVQLKRIFDAIKQGGPEGEKIS